MNHFPIIKTVALLAVVNIASASGNECSPTSASLQVLGSGGTHISSQRAGNSFLLRNSKQTYILINAGGGSALRFAQSGVDIDRLDAVLLTNVQTDSTAALPALIQMSVDKKRKAPLPVYGPGGYGATPSTVALVRALFEVSRGAYRHLGNVLTPLDKNAFKLEPHNIDIRFKKGAPLLAGGKASVTILKNQFRIITAPVLRQQIPALAWRVEMDGKAVIFAGKTTAATQSLADMSRGADILVVPAPYTDGGSISFANIGRLAARSDIKKIVLTHLADGSSENSESPKEQIRPFFSGEVFLATDLDCFNL